MPRKFTKPILFVGVVTFSAMATIVGLRSDSALVTVLILAVGITIICIAVSWIAFTDMLTAATASIVMLACAAFSLAAFESGQIAIGLAALLVVVLGGLWVARIANNTVERWRDRESH